MYSSYWSAGVVSVQAQNLRRNYRTGQDPESLSREIHMPSPLQQRTDQAPLRALVVDDEEHSRRNLSQHLRTYCPEIEVIAEADCVSNARQCIGREQPDVVFLDIHMPGENGFDLLGSLEDRDFLLVFVTAHDSYGIQAIKASAVDYLLKPICLEELRSSVQKLLRLQEMRNDQRSPAMDVYRESLAELAHALKTNTHPRKIVLPTSEGLIIESVENIIRLEADRSYTFVVRKNAPKILLAKTLKEFESALDPGNFVRLHHSHIVNLLCVQQFDKRDGGYVVMADGARVPVSRRRHSRLVESLKTFHWI